jgi:hypothetical protein
MKGLRFTHCLVAASIVVGSIAAAQGEDLTTSQLLDGSRCDHVIHLMHRYGVNNSVNCGPGASMLYHSPLGGLVINESDLGDLEIMQVSRIEHEDAVCGPRFAVLVRNHSCRDVCNFHVSVVGILGRIVPCSPNATVSVERICAGETLQVDVTLPIEALAMGNRNGQIIGMQRLVVVIDSFDQLVETNEANNLKAFDITQVPVLAPVVEQTAEAVAPSAVETGVAPATIAPGASPATESVAPQAAEPSADPLRSAIRQLANEPASEATTVTAP